MKKIVVITLLELKKTKNEKNCFNHFVLITFKSKRHQKPQHLLSSSINSIL